MAGSLSASCDPEDAGVGSHGRSGVVVGGGQVILHGTVKRPYFDTLFSKNSFFFSKIFLG
jgi:hypothetical protein